MRGACNQQASWSEPPSDVAQQTRLLSERDMDEGVEANDRVEARVGQLHRRHVGASERGRRHERPGAFDLHGREIDAGDLVSGREAAGDRHAASAAEV